MFGMNENHCKAAVFRNALKVIKHSGESYLIEAEFCIQKIFGIRIFFNYDNKNCNDC